MRSRGPIIDATLAIIADSGFEGISIAAVAEKAGVSRQTVYSIFGTREDMVSQALAELTLDLMGRLRDRLDEMTTPADFVVEFIVASRTTSREDPILSTLLHAQRGNPLFDPDMMLRARPVSRALIEPLATLSPGLEPHMDSIAEMVTLLGAAVILFGDEHKSDDELRRFLHSWCDPAIAGFKG